jgi:4'-phosphopantetheinyl transferase
MVEMSSHSVHVAFVEPDSPEVVARLSIYEALLTNEESERMQRYAQDRDRRNFLVARALVRTMLSRYAEVRPEVWRFVPGTHGRPEIVDPPAGTPDLRFNVSHTAGLTVCAVAVGRDIGVDVERIDRRLTHDIAERFFAASEVAELRARPVEEQPLAFFDYWTLKEAYIKARGLGLALPLSQFAFRLAPPEPVTITFDPLLEDDPATWQFAQAWPTARHRLALAIRRTGDDLSVQLQQVVP